MDVGVAVGVLLEVSTDCVALTLTLTEMGLDVLLEGMGKDGLGLGNFLGELLVEVG